MSELAPAGPVSPEQHRDLERRTGLRHELVDGEVFAMTGGTPRHAKVKTNLTVQVGALLGDGPCQAFDADLSVRVGDDVMYPDLTIVCGPLQSHPDDANAVTNPTLVAEVLSPSTEAWDRGGKFARYRSMPSVRQVLLISVHHPRVESYHRVDGTWVLRDAGPGEIVALLDLDVNLQVADLYKNLPAATEPVSR